jgi:uncharacterized membrane protein (DUF485 family)
MPKVLFERTKNFGFIPKTKMAHFLRYFSFIWLFVNVYIIVDATRHSLTRGFKVTIIAFMITLVYSGAMLIYFYKHSYKNF